MIPSYYSWPSNCLTSEKKVTYLVSSSTLLLSIIISLPICTYGLWWCPGSVVPCSRPASIVALLSDPLWYGMVLTSAFPPSNSLSDRGFSIIDIFRSSSAISALLLLLPTCWASILWNVSSMDSSIAVGSRPPASGTSSPSLSIDTLQVLHSVFVKAAWGVGRTEYKSSTKLPGCCAGAVGNRVECGVPTEGGMLPVTDLGCSGVPVVVVAVVMDVPVGDAALDEGIPVFPGYWKVLELFILCFLPVSPNLLFWRFSLWTETGVETEETETPKILFSNKTHNVFTNFLWENI